MDPPKQGIEIVKIVHIYICMCIYIYTYTHISKTGCVAAVLSCDWRRSQDLEFTDLHFGL